MSEKTSRCGRQYKTKASRQSHESRCSTCQLAKSDPEFAELLLEANAQKSLIALEAEFALAYPCEFCRGMAMECADENLSDRSPEGHTLTWRGMLEVRREAWDYLDARMTGCYEHRPEND